MTSAEKTWSSVKTYVSVFGAFLLWGVSVIFFVIGFSFGSHMEFAGIDFGIPIAIIISVVNTVFQIAWNDKREDVWEWGLWVASYVVGIVSNYMGLVLILNMSDPMMERILAGALGAMIEIGPEKLLIRGLREMKFSFGKPKFASKPNNGNNGGGNKGGSPLSPEQLARERAARQDAYRSANNGGNKPAPATSNRPAYNEPTYHPVGMNAQDKPKPNNDPLFPFQK